MSGKVIKLMDTLLDKEHIINYKQFSLPSWKEAKMEFEYKAPIATRDELYSLSRSLILTIIKSWANNGNYVENTTRIIHDWAQSVTSVSTHFEGSEIMYRPFGEHYFINKILKNPKTKYVYSFNVNKTKHIWAVVDETNADIEYEYSRYFTETLIEINNFYCDFMVFSEEEIKKCTLPNDAEVIFN